MAQDVHTQGQGSGTDVLLDVKSFLANAASYSNRSVHAAILFADLVGSTEFKRHHSILDGLAKVVQHNDVARECIEQFGGSVVKYNGDGVMGLFKEEDCEHRALQAGLEMVRQIQVANVRQRWQHYPFSMSTKIGIHSGPVWMFQYAGSPEDPQGTTVDIAARLVSLAGHDQILCTKEVYEQASKGGQLPKPRDEFHRYLKGIDEPFALTVVVPEGFGYQPPSIDGMWPEVEQKLKGAYRLIEQKKFDEALPVFRQVADEYRGDFTANVCTAEQLLCDHGGGEHGSPDEDRLCAAEVYVGRALSCRPDSSHAWLLAGWLHLKRYVRDQDALPIREAIECARRAWRLAQASRDAGGALQARVCLIHFLQTLARGEEDRVALDDARRLCVEVRPFVDGALNECRSDFYVFYTAVQLLSGSRDFDMLRDMVKKAKDFNPGNFRVYEVEQELIRLCYANGGVAGMSPPSLT